MPTIAKLAVLEIKKGTKTIFTLNSVITRGDKAWPETADVKLTPASATVNLPPDQAELTAKVFDIDGNEDPDVLFHWEVEPTNTSPNPTTAEIGLLTRDGHRAWVKNRIHRHEGVWVSSNGDCRAITYCRYQGYFRRGSVEDSAVALKMVAP